MGTIPEVSELEGFLQDTLNLAIPRELALPVCSGCALICGNLFRKLLLYIQQVALSSQQGLNFLFYLRRVTQHRIDIEKEDT